jgi:hypothetical protein
MPTISERCTVSDTSVELAVAAQPFDDEQRIVMVDRGRGGNTYSIVRPVIR